MPSVVTSTAQPQGAAQGTVLTLPSGSNAAPTAGSGLSESELIKNLETSAMASVAAARALEVGSQVSLSPESIMVCSDDTLLVLALKIFY